MSILDAFCLPTRWRSSPAPPPVMESGSSIIDIGSVLGSTTAGLPQAAYAASKAAIIGLTRDLAQQCTGRKGIRVNALAPGFFHSEMTEQYPEAISTRCSRSTAVC